MSFEPRRAAGRGLSLVVPLFNEEGRVRETSGELVRFVGSCGPGSELLYVDDGSTDGTAAVVEHLRRSLGAPVRLIRRPHRGKGAAVRTGLGEARAEFAGFTDVDLSTSVDQLGAIHRVAVMSPVLAIGSRDVAGSQVLVAERRARELLGKSFNRLVQLALTPGIADTQCGAKIASTAIWKAVLPWCEEPGFAWDVEALAVACRLGIPVREVGIHWRHDERSRVHVGSDGLKMVLAVRSIRRRVKRVPQAALTTGAVGNDRAVASVEPGSQHQWFQSKAALASSVLRRHLTPSLADSRLIDVGAGAGAVTAALGWRPDRVFVVDASEAICRTSRDRHALFAMTGSVEHLPFGDRVAGVVTALDVIEHLERPKSMLDEVWRVLVDDGLLLVTVPAHRGADDLPGHGRRYADRLLRQQVEGAGFRVLWSSHVLIWAVLPGWARRRSGGFATGEVGPGERSSLAERSTLLLTALERVVVPRVALPVGPSVLAVMEKVAQPAPSQPAQAGTGHG